MNAINYFEFLAFGCSLLLLHPNVLGKRLWLVTVAMGITVIAELLGWHFRFNLARPNHTIYNISVPLIVLTFQFLFISHVSNSMYRKRMLWLVGLYIVLSILNLVFIQGADRFATYNYITGGIILALCCCFYFVGLIRYPKHISLVGQPLFIIASGILIMYLPKTVLYALFAYWAYRGVSHKEFTAVYQLLNTVLSGIFYSFIVIASLMASIWRTSSTQ